MNLDNNLDLDLELELDIVDNDDLSDDDREVLETLEEFGY